MESVPAAFAEPERAWGPLPFLQEAALLVIFGMSSYKEKASVWPVVCSGVLPTLQKRSAWEPLRVEHNEVTHLKTSFSSACRGVQSDFEVSVRLSFRPTNLPDRVREDAPDFVQRFFKEQEFQQQWDWARGKEGEVP